MNAKLHHACETKVARPEAISQSYVTEYRPSLTTSAVIEEVVAAYAKSRPSILRISVVQLVCRKDVTHNMCDLSVDKTEP